MTGLSVMMAADGLLHFYLVVTMILRQQTDHTLGDTINIITSLLNLPIDEYSQLIVHILIATFFLTLFAAFVIVVIKTHSLSTLNSMPTAKRVLTLVFVGLMTCLQIPLLEVIIGMAFIQTAGQGDSQILSVIYFLAVVNGLLFLATAFLLQKLYIIRIPSIQVHWAASNTQLHSMKLINKIALVLCHLYITTVNGSVVYASVACFVLFAGTGLSRIMLIPHYRQLVEWYTRITELMTACLLLILTVAQTLAQSHIDSGKEGPVDLGLCLLVSFVSIPCTLCLAILVDLTRSRQLWSKLERNELKLEIELEHSLYLLIERVKVAMGFDDKSALAFSDILYLVDIHNRTCNNHNCPCQRRQIVQYLLNKGHIFDTKRLVLDEEEIDLLNSAGTNVFIKSSKANQALKTLTLFQHFNFYAAAAAAELSDTPAGTNKGHEANNQTQQQQEDLAKQAQRVRVNVAQLKITFLNQFAEIFFEESRKKFPQSKVLFFQYAYFTLQCCKNRYMTETLLRNFEATSNTSSNNRSSSWIEKVSIQVNELQTIMEIDYMAEQRSGRGIMGGDDDDASQSDAANWGVTNIRNGRVDEDPNSLKKNGQYSSLEKFDPEHFIQISELTEHFYEEVEYLSTAVSSFWKLIQNEALEVDTAHKESVGLAEIIARVYKTFKEIEEVSEGGSGTSSLGKQTDFRVCFTFAQLQRLLLNDITQYDLYMAKMNSQREMQRLLRNNMLQQQSKGPEDTGFALVHGSNRNFGKLILCNQLFRKQLDLTSKELRHANIVDFMPELIKQWHKGFVADFSRNGGASNGMLNRTNCLFMRKKNGYVTPAMVNVRFHYSRDHEFTFVLFASFMQEIQIQRTAGTGRHKVEEILFFLCDNQDGRIIDISESCSKQLGLSMNVLHNSDLETVQSNLTVEDICPTLSFKKLKKLRADSDSSLGIGATAIEELVDVDLNVVHTLGSNVKQDASKSQRQKALCQVFLETYGAEKDKTMNIVSLILLDQLAMKEYLSQQRAAKREQRSQRQHRRDRQDNPLGPIEEQASVEMSMASQSLNNNESNSSASHSSRTNGSSETSVLKQLYSSTDKTASSSLKLITQLILMVFLLLLVVSTINLVLSLNRYEQLQNEVKTVRQSYDRIQINGKTRLLLRGLLNVANGYEPNSSEMTNDRFRMFLDELDKQINRLKDVQDYLDKDDFQYSSEFKEILDEKSISVAYLNPFNQAFEEQQTFTYAINLFIQRASTLRTWGIERYKGNIKTMQIYPPPSNYTPTDDERTLYFLLETAQGNLRSQGKKISDYYRQETELHALQVAQQTQLTIIVSIASILLVCVAVSPIICRIEQRKYMGLKFFLNVEHGHLILLEQQVKEFLQLAFSDASVHTGSTHQEGRDKHAKKAANAYVDNYEMYAADVHQASKQSSSSMSRDNFARGDNGVSDSESLGDDSYMEINSRKVEKQSHEALKDYSVNSRDVIGAAMKIETSSIKKANISIDSSLDSSQANNNHDGEEEAQPNEVLSAEEQELENQRARKLIMDTKFLRISQIVFRQKMKTVLFIAVLGLIFSSYFIAGYFFSVKPFQETPDIIKSLDTVFFRDITVENAMGFVRSNYLMNTTIPSVEDPSQTGADFFLKWSEDRERAFLDMRRNLPSVFAEIKSYFDEIETVDLCRIANKDAIDFEERTKLCKRVYFGVLQNGLTYTMAVILNHFRNLNMRFDSTPRTYDFLTKGLRDNATLSLIEVKHFVMDNVFTDMKNMVTQSTTDYYGALIRQYTILYSLFVLLMFALFIIYLGIGYNMIKDAMWKTNLTLKIMPLDFIPRHCLPELKAFFKS